MNKRNLTLTLFGWLLFCAIVRADTGDQVVVIYNDRVPESKGVAEYYASKRQIPKSQLIGLDLPAGEDISRHDFREHLQKPLLKALESKGLLTFETRTIAATNGQPRHTIHSVTKAKIRYLTLCYGVPLRISPVADLHEPGAENMRAEIRKNGAAVDNELACLTMLDQSMILSGPITNRWFACTNSEFLNPTNDILMVARLDGPTATIARGLVDKALEAETNGLWGRAYFDLRGLTNGEYKLGDDWIRDAAAICKSVGFDTIIDDNPGTFPASFPMSQAAFYVGWYDENASGPIARGTVEFMPGAFAYHLHSFSAATLRSTTRQWVGPLLARGATATMGCVDEPFLPGTPVISIFFARFIYSGFTFGEAAYACQSYLSWQTTVVGDPLYRPFLRPPEVIAQDLVKQKNPLLQWDFLRIINSSLARKVPLEKVLGALEKINGVETSPILEEKLAELYVANNKPAASIASLQQVLKLQTTPQERIRVLLDLAQQLVAAKREEEAFQVYQQFVKENPDYPDKPVIYRSLIDLGQKLGHNSEAAKYELELNRLN